MTIQNNRRPWVLAAWTTLALVIGITHTRCNHEEGKFIRQAEPPLSMEAK